MLRAFESLAIASSVIALAACAPAPRPCPADATAWVSTTVRGQEFEEPRVHTTYEPSGACKSLVVGPMVSPDFTEVGWIEDRGDHRSFVVNGRETVRLRGDVTALTLGLDGSGTVHVLAPSLQLFVHRQGAGDALRWKGALECPSCRVSHMTRYFDVAVSGPLELVETPDGSLALLTVPSATAHAKVYLLDSKTPAASPSADDYLELKGDEATARGMKRGVRVWLGTSEGPVFDAVRAESFVRDEAGAIHYEGARGGLVFDVVDNVLGAPRSSGAPVRAR